MYHIGLGRTLDGTCIIPLIHSYAIRVIHAATGEFIRTLTLTINPQRRYHGTGKPTGGLCDFARIITTTSSPVVTEFRPLCGRRWRRDRAHLGGSRRRRRPGPGRRRPCAAT